MRHSSISSPAHPASMADISLSWQRQMLPSAQSLAVKDLNWGLHYYQKGQLTKALGKFEAALAYFVQAEDEEGMGKCLNGLSAVYLHHQAYGRSLAYSQAAAVILATASAAAQPDYALALYQQGISHFKLGNLAAAEGCFDQALTIYYTLEDVNNENRVLLCLGQLYAQQGKYLFALASYEAVLDSLLAYPAQDEVSTLLQGVLATMMQICESTKAGEAAAIAAYHTLLERHLPHAHGEHAAHLMQQLGQFHEAQEHYGRALECYAQALQTVMPVEVG